MSWDLGYMAGQAAERAICENILAIKEGQWRQKINEVAAQCDHLEHQLQVLQGQLREQIAYSEDVQRDLDKALQALAKAGANPIERQALTVAPHIRRQKIAEEERRRREEAEEQKRLRQHEEYLAALPEMLRRERIANRTRKALRFILISGLLYWGGTALYDYVTKPKVMSRILENWYVNRVLPLQKPEQVSLDSYGCLNCHHSNSGESFMVYQLRFRRLATTAQKKEALTRMSSAVASKPAVKRFDLSEADVQKLATDITRGVYGYR